MRMECDYPESTRPGPLEKSRGFTLIELMVVIAIIGILAAAAMMSYMTALNRSRVAACKVTLGTVQKGMEMYKNSTDSYPVTIGGFNDIAEALKDEVTMKSDTICQFVSYTYNSSDSSYTLKTKIVYNIPGHGMKLTLTPDGIEEEKY